MSKQQIRDGAISDVIIRSLAGHGDSRGWLCEFFRMDELNDENYPRMAYVSETLPGVVRGPHEHVEQSDLFAFVGPGDFQLYLWDNRPQSSTYLARRTLLVGETNPVRVVVPPGVVHAYKNVGDAPAWVFNAPNRLYAGPGKTESVDEIRHEDNPDSIFVVDRGPAAAVHQS